jgi:hypothetical protein
LIPCTGRMMAFIKWQQCFLLDSFQCWIRHTMSFVRIQVGVTCLLALQLTDPLCYRQSRWR